MSRERANVVVTRDVPFRETPERTLGLDLYRPADGDAAARDVAAAFVHGGAWREGSNGVFSRYALDAAAEGFVCATVDYRLAPEATFPAQIRDVTAAVRWLRNRPSEFGGGSDLVATVGHSAGAHLAALAAVAGDSAAFASDDADFEDGGSDVRDAAGRSDAAVGMSGVYDFVEPGGGYSDPDEFVDLFGGTADELPDAYRDASPVSHVSADAPPHLLFHGTDDDLVPPTQTEQYRDALDDAGADTEYVAVEGGGHSFLHSTAHFGDARDRLLEFLRTAA